MIYIFWAAFDPPHVGHSAIIRALLHYKNPKKIIIIPSGKRNDKSYHVNDEHRLAMLQIFVSEIGDERVIIDDYFVRNWEGEMITRDVDVYVREQYGEDIVHVFWTDTIATMPEWDEEWYAAKRVKKLFVPRSSVVSESSPQWGELEGCVTFVSPKSYIYLKEYASELRKNQTYPELLAWKNIFSKKQLLGYKVLRQHTLWSYIVDFYIHALKLIIEIDGDIHSLQKEKDIIRDIFFVKHGYRVIRIPAFEILWNMSWVYEFLREYITHPPNLPNIGRDWNPHPPNLPNIGRDWNPHPPNLPNIGRNETTEATCSSGLLFSGDGFSHIENYELFTDSHIPDVSSTEIREIIPEHTTLKTLFEEDPKFIIKWLSNRISRYILEHRLYRPKLEQKPKILVHVCCGPDVTMPILQLRDEYDVICFWYDPNIQPKSEYDKRYEAFVKVCEIENIPYIKWAYDVGNFFTRIRGVEHTPERWEKCTYCYDMRMMVSAKLAKRLKIPLYTSSLNTSPKKDLEKLFKMGHLYAEKYGVEFLDIPFRKRGWFEKSVEYTREHDIYRQNYCGCIYSIREGGESEMKKRMVG
jgi:predicted adenine nucleotide alpha hydrolase (AANH) superfamily ATPase/very-short-patch-repair endonuclease